MNKQNRRAFLQTSAAALATSFGAMRTVAKGAVIPSALPANLSTAQGSPSVAANEGKKPLRLGLIIGVGNNPDAAMAKVHDLGLPTCQVFVNEIEAELVSRLRQALDRYQIEATSLVVGGPGKEVWDFYQGPLTIGLVPRETRAARIAHIKKASDFAKQCGIPAVQTHCGFIPENPNDPVYKETVAAMREVAAYCKRNGQNFRYETGQETPITLVRAKDGMWPTNPKELGQEVPIGKGKVDFPRIITRLKELNYRGAITIEREISGPQQLEDVQEAKTYLEKLIG